MPRLTSRVVVAIAAVLVAALAAGYAIVWAIWLSEPAARPASTPVVTVDGQPVPKELFSYYAQQIEWFACERGHECASVEVPLDYEDPEGERITLALRRAPAGQQGSRVGSLLVNPGGPGVSGVELMDSIDIFSRELRDAFDVVGFDPRGVGKSAPVECVSDAELDELRAKVYPDSEAGIKELTADSERVADACLENTGPLLGHVDTVSAARDMDVLRAVLGDEKLYYLGYSYGTFLGATYADLFPERVGRMVLDGAVDPAVGPVDVALRQAAGFEAALRSFVADCLASSGCPLRGTVDDGVAQIQRFLQMLEGSPLPTATERDLTQSLGVNGVLFALYDDRLWPILSEGLDQAMNNDDGSQLLFLADFSADRQDDGTYASNRSFAYSAVTCLDAPVDADPALMAAEAERLKVVSPTFGEFFAYHEIGCAVWPVKTTGTVGPLPAEGAPPIVVIGTTGDPATPYEDAVSLAEQLESGILVTFEGEGHTAYGRSNDCIVEAVDGYLIRGEVPADGLVC